MSGFDPRMPVLAAADGAPRRSAPSDGWSRSPKTLFEELLRLLESPEARPDYEADDEASRELGPPPDIGPNATVIGVTNWWYFKVSPELSLSEATLDLIATSEEAFDYCWENRRTVTQEPPHDERRTQPPDTRASRTTLGLSLLAFAVSASAQPPNDPERNCFCTPSPGWPTDAVPRNATPFYDGIRFDPETFRFRTSPGLEPTEERPARFEPFFETGVYVAVPEEMPGPGYMTMIAIPRESYPDHVSHLNSVSRILDYVDTTPPEVLGLRVSDRILVNPCGAQALRLEVDAIGDDFVTLWRFPIHVVLEAGDKRHETLTGAFARADEDLDPAPVGIAPFMGDCITDTGLESLGWEPGEPVTVTMTVYDHAGNAAEPVVQTIEWPIGVSDGGCTASRAGPPPAAHVLATLALLLWCGSRRRRRVSRR